MLTQKILNILYIKDLILSIKTKKLKIVKKIDILPKAKVLFKIVDLKK